MTNLISPRRVLPLILLPLLTATTGCTFGPCSTPIYMLPVALAIAPLALTVDALQTLDHHDSTPCPDYDFLLAGQIVDDQNHPLNAVDVRFIKWITTSQTPSGTNEWEHRLERHTLDSKFQLEVSNAQTLEIIFRHPACEEQRIVLTATTPPPEFIRLIPNTEQPSKSANNITAQLEGGGTYYQFKENTRPFTLKNLKIVMQRELLKLREYNQQHLAHSIRFAVSQDGFAGTML